MPVSGPCEYAVTALHSHPSYLFVLPFNDRVSFKIGSQDIMTEPNKLLALAPNTPHNEVITDRFPRYIAIFIDKLFFEEQLDHYPITEDIYFGGFIPIPPSFLNIIKEFMLEVDNQIPGSESVIYAINLKICHLIIRSVLKLSHKHDKVTHRLEINRTLEYMYSNFDERITIEDLAVIAHMSPSHYARTFKKEIGQSSISYLNEIRLEHVKRFLLEGDKSITEIALECGFSSPAYLSSSFYNKFKLSPTDYQKLFNNDDISKV